MTVPISIETSSLQKVDGSAVWTQGVTKVVFSVSGPMEVKIREELPNEATLELVVRPVTGLSSTREALIEDRLHSLLGSIILKHLYPRSLIQMVVQVLESGESRRNNVLELAAAINAATVALIDAGVPVNGLITSTSIAIDDSDQLVLWPTAEQLKTAISTHCIAYEIVAGQPDRLLLCESTGLFTKEQFLQCLDAALPECVRLYNVIREAIGRQLQKDFVWKDYDRFAV